MKERPSIASGSVPRAAVCTFAALAAAALFAAQAQGGADASGEASGVVSEAGAAADAAVAARIAECDAGMEKLAKAYAECAARLDRPAEGVMVPVESYPDGAVKTDVEAEKAQFFEKEGFVWCGGVTVREYAPGGAVKAEFRAETCLVDRAAKTGWAPGRVKGAYGGTTLEGTGFYFSFSGESVRIYGKVKIRSTDIKLKGMKL